MADKAPQDEMFAKKSGGESFARMKKKTGMGKKMPAPKMSAHKAGKK